MNKKLAFLAGALAIVLVAGFFAIRALTAPTERTFAADFADTTGVYVGNNVTYLGCRSARSPRSPLRAPRCECN